MAVIPLNRHGGIGLLLVLSSMKVASHVSSQDATFINDRTSKSLIPVVCLTHSDCDYATFIDDRTNKSLILAGQPRSP